jgi:putative transcriptional regulator
MSIAPQFHPSEDLLLDYASGALPEAPALLIATHASMCATCARELERLDELGGALVAAAEPTRLPASLKQSVLDRLATTPAAPAAAPSPAPASAGADWLLAPLHAYVGSDAAAIEWKWLAPGARQASLSLTWRGEPLRLVRLSRGFVIPKHMHTGRELTLVLDGELSDEHATYRTGDVSDYDHSVEHRQKVTGAEACICLIANDGRVVPKTMIGRLLSKITGV